MSGFKTKARTVELLGRKQIRDSVTALAELMKNSYDADASLLRVEFDTISEKQHVVIADNGMGMSQEDIETKWLVLGTNSKTHTGKKTSPDGRPLMGAKGIGRLASATMGKQLWLFSKTESSDWNIVYVFWDIFENPNLSIEEITVPTRYNVSQEDLLKNMDSILHDMLQEQIKNFDNSAWMRDGGLPNDVSRIISELMNDNIDTQVIKKYILGFQHGTIMHIDSLYDDWNKYISSSAAETRKNNVMLEKMYNRFASFTSTFKHAPISNLPFNVEIFIDGDIWNAAFDFDEEDYSLYDVKVEGIIKEGLFKGKLFARNADQSLLDACNQELINGISVTSGMTDWKKSDCGKFSIKFCHIEGDIKRSGLTPDDYHRLQNKLQTTCGICVYRDGVRILPYGEPENDFLNIEARRTEKAGRYIFSHRNIFGRIDIDTEHNPMLEDKSSREGLIENQYYFYFVKTLENLLIYVALNYLSSVRKDSLKIQSSYVQQNIEENERSKTLQDIEKREKKQAIEYIKSFNEWEKRIYKTIESIEAKVPNACAELQNSASKLSYQDGYYVLAHFIDNVDKIKQYIEKQVADLENQVFIIPKEYKQYFKEEMLETLDDINHRISTTCIIQRKNINKAVELSVEHIKNEIAKWTKNIADSTQKDPDIIKKELLMHISTFTSEAAISQNEIIKSYIAQILKLKSNIKQIYDLIEDLDGYGGYKCMNEWLEIIRLVDETNAEKQKVEDLFNHSPEIVNSLSKEILSSIEAQNNKLHEALYKLRYACNSKISDWTQICSELMRVLDYTNSDLSSSQIISTLRQENVELTAQLDIYSDLANMGLAAEIVNHEFNQLFLNVGHAINSLKPYIKDSAARYWLREIDMGFRSISDRQNQLSPMYRSYSLKRTKTNLHSFIEEIRRFMEAELERRHVELENNVPDTVEIKLSKSKVFPAISNLINNSLYWVSDSDIKKIQFRYSKDHRALYINDSGKGILIREKERIFEPFVTAKPNGRGLGLTVAKKVLESQGYKLEIASDEERLLPGACFRIVFSEEDTEE